MLLQTVDALDNFRSTLKGVAALINDMQMSNDSGEHVYAEHKYIVLEDVLFKVIDDMKKFRDDVDIERKE